MSGELRQTGINVIGTVPWGTHFCQFYQTKEDLLDILIPYFKAGLENNEFCMWITAEPLNVQDVHEAMRRAMPDFADRLAKGQIEILPHTDWYLKGGSFDQQRVLNGWVDKLNKALTEGYAGLRLTGNTFWLEKRDWKSFTDYEAAVNNVIGKYRMLALCTYSLAKCDATEVIDVIRNHEFALVRKEGEWELIENAIHKQAKQALRESERKYRQLLDTLQEGVWVIDKDMLTTFVNPHMAEMLGYTLDEMLGKHLFSFVELSKLGIAKENMDRRRQGIKERVEFEFRRKDGNLLHTLVSAAPVFDDRGDFSGVVAGIVDITERKQAENAIRESQEKLQAAFASMTEAIFIADAEGRLIDFNDEFVRYHRFKDRDECSRTISDCPKYLDVWFSDGRPAPPEQWAMPRALRGETASNVEYRLRRRETGETWWGSYSFTPIRDQDGSIVGAVVAGREITERKQMEERLAHLASFPELNPLFVVEMDSMGNANYANPAARRLFPELKTMGAEHPYLAGIPELIRLGEPLRNAQTIREIKIGKHYYQQVIMMTPDNRFVRIYGTDITDRKQDEDDLRRRQAEIQALFDNSPAGLVLFDATPPYTVLVHNRYYQELFAEPFRSQGMVGLNVYDYAPEVEAAGVVAVFDEVVRTKQPKSFLDFPYASNPPKKSWFNWHMSPIILDGEVIALVSMSIEVTERHMAEEALRDAVLRYRTVADNTYDFEFWVSPEGQFLYASPSCQRIYGHMPEEFMADPGLQRRLIYPDAMAMFDSHVAGEVRRVQGEIEFRIVRADGTHRWISHACQPVFDAHGQYLGVRGSNRDITERKQAEEMLRETRDYLDNLLNYANAPVIVWDPEFRITRFNRAFERLTGYNVSEVLGKKLYILFPEQTRKESLKLIIRTLSGERWESIEIPILREDGSVRTVLWNSATLYAPDGKTVFATIAQGQDITELKRREEKIIKLTRLYSVLSRANETIVRIGDAKSLCSEVCRIVAEGGGFPLVWVGQLEEQHVVPLAWSGLAADYLKEIKVEVQGELGRGPTGTCIRENRAVVNDDFAMNTTVSPWREAALRYGFHASAAFPLRRKGEAIGALTIYSLEPGAFDADQIRLLESLGADVSYALDSIDKEQRRKQAEEALRETRDYLDNLLNYANAPIIVWDPEFRITSFNRAFERLTGYNVKEVLGKKLAILFPAQTREESLEHIRQTASGERWEVIEIPILRTDSSVRTVLWNSATLYSPDGKTVVATIAQGQDITERKQAEQELARQAFMLANVSDSVMGIDLDYRINYWSLSAERMYGYSAAEAMGKTTLDLIKPEYVGERREDALQRLMNSGYLETEYVHETKDGRRLNIELRSTLLRNDRGEPFGIISVNRDITERKRSEEVQHIGNMGSWEWNVITGELDWSDEIFFIFGLKSGQFEGTHEAFLNYVHPDDRKKLELAENEALHDHKKNKYSIELRIVRPDGSVRVIRDNARVYHSPKGEPVQMIGTIQDITERKAVEERLKSLSRRLVDMQEEERRGIARELHDGLAQSLAVAKILLDRGTKPSVDVGPIIDEARNAIQDVIDQVREMSLNLRPSMLDDMGLLPALQWHFEQVTSRTGVKINFKHTGLKLASSSGVSPEVRTAVYRIVQEALSNAIRHAEVDQIDVTIRIRSNILRLLVEDHGKGFDLNAMPPVSSGLSTMQERAYLCGGSLIVESAPGLGTRISAEIPLLVKED